MSCKGLQAGSYCEQPAVAHHPASGNGPVNAAGAGPDPAASTAGAAAAAVDGVAPADGSNAGRQRRRLMQLEAKLQRYMDSEDRRVKELTEGVLYELLPSALNVMLPHCEDPLQELDAERCRAVAGAALAVSSLMNAPPGFLEFLLCIPWRQLPLLYPGAHKAPGQQEQQEQDEQQEQGQQQEQQSPEQVDHLLYCGADPSMRTAAGELALELVPLCGSINKESRRRQCHCLGPVEQEAWECRSRIARNLIARRCLLAFQVGLLRFLSLAWLCLLALLGLAARDGSLQRPTLQAHAIRMAHIAAARLFGRVQKLQQQHPQRWRAVGQALSRVVYAHIALLCQTEARASPSKASLWRAQQCLQEWDRLAAAGLVGCAGGTGGAAAGDTQLVVALRMWARTAESDLIIAEALLGSSLGPLTTLAEALAAALLLVPAQHQGSSSAGDAGQVDAAGTGSSSCSCLPVLARPVSAALLDQLQAARGLATCMSPAVKQLAAQVADATERELSAGERLEELLAARSAHSSSEVQGFDAACWERCVALLEAAVEEAKEANVSVLKARKLMKKLQAQLAAADASAALDACMARRPCGSAALKAAIAKAEAAAAAIAGAATQTSSGAASASASSAHSSSSGSSGSSAMAAAGCAGFGEALLARLQAGKKRLEVERACEALHKASLAHRGVGELPKLEAAILNARKVGAEELAPEEYKAASELRARLTSAARVKQQLEAALRGLALAAGRQPDEAAEAVEAAIKEAARWEDLLPGEASRAADALEAWRASSACEAKLSKALRDGCSSGQLSRLVTEAAAAGVKVAAARRILKLQQLLEAAAAAADEASGVSSSQHSALAAKLEAAEQGGVAPVVLEPARRLLQRLAAHEARQALEAALKPHSDWSANTRIAALRVALDKAEDVLGVPAQQLAEQQQQQQHWGEAQQEQESEQQGVAQQHA
ncbi:hypothetical protein OEZ85_008235 [Tetradesmus obliquus]|uniref:Uncharacterized protein n=1 Tax=Tetradesmus obliquus TaxID=3088 RepID=A0ABY8TKA5_TETOB|nr:hypothetical protein OEZ85_008235 [Tetradesmus obliquus]